MGAKFVFQSAEIRVFKWCYNSEKPCNISREEVRNKFRSAGSH